LRPRDARTAYLNGHTSEQAAAIVMQADRIGPGHDDADWLVAKAAADAAKRIEAAAPPIEKALSALAEQLDRVEATVDDLKAKKAEPAAAPDSTIVARLERIEAKLQKVLRADVGSPESGHGRLYRDAWAFLVALLALVAVTVAGSGEHVPSGLYLVAAGAIGALITTVYLFLVPMLKR